MYVCQITFVRQGITEAIHCTCDCLESAFHYYYEFVSMAEDSCEYDIDILSFLVFKTLKRW